MLRFGLTPLLVVCALSWSGSAHAQVASGRWTLRAQGPIPFYQGGIASDGTALHAFGGADATQSMSHVLYSPATDTWSLLGGFTQQVAYNRGAFAHGRFISFGSLQYPPLPFGPPAVNDPILSYDAGSNAWEVEAAKMPLYSSAVGVLGDKVYLGTGATTAPFASRSSTFYEFDAVTNTLTVKAPLPYELNYSAGAADPTRNTVYVYGGASADAGVLPYLYAYDPGSNSWARRADLNVGGGLVGAVAFAISGTLYVAGGSYLDGGLHPMRTVFAYDAVSNTWSPRSCMNLTHTFGGAAVVGSKAYVYGNATTPDGGEPLEEFDPTADGGLAGCVTGTGGGGEGVGGGSGTGGGAAGGAGGAAGGHAGGAGGGAAGGGAAGGGAAGGTTAAGGGSSGAGGGTSSAGGGTSAAGGGSAGGTGGGMTEPHGCGCSSGAAQLVAGLALASMLRRRRSVS